MKPLLLSFALIVGFSAAAAPATAATRNYDCSKAGNANKSVCKAAAASAAKAAKPAKAPNAASPKAAATRVSSTTTTRTTTERQYDCSKAGNKNKAICKAATPAKPVVEQKATTTATRHYDCSKAGNANKQQCKVSTTTQQAPAKPIERPKNTQAAPARRAAPARTTATADDRNAAGATALCKDGTYSHAKEHRGACSRHGGVAKWM